jgi:hypothetical protein
MMDRAICYCLTLTNAIRKCCTGSGWTLSVRVIMAESYCRLTTLATFTALLLTQTMRCCMWDITSMSVYIRYCIGDNRHCIIALYILHSFNTKLLTRHSAQTLHLLTVRRHKVASTCTALNTVSSNLPHTIHTII